MDGVLVAASRVGARHMQQMSSTPPSGETRADYGVISRFVDPQSQQPVLVLAGIGGDERTISYVFSTGVGVPIPSLATLQFPFESTRYSPHFGQSSAASLGRGNRSDARNPGPIPKRASSGRLL